ncbi:hypothetical protein ACP4OV_001024 [Aristida adscensionis]
MAAGRMETMDAFLGEPDRRRIRRELRRLWADSPAFCRPGASPVTDLLHWEVLIDGPDGSPYAGGTFPVDVRFAGGYPMEPPEITFRAKIYHPNVDEQGRLDGGGGGNAAAAAVYEGDLRLYEEIARAWTLAYASSPVASRFPRADDEPWLDYCDAVAAMCAAEKKAERTVRRWTEEERIRQLLRRSADDERTRRAALPCGENESESDVGVSLLWTRAVAFLQGWCSAALLLAARAIQI